jgi:hypothetical protein
MCQRALMSICTGLSAFALLPAAANAATYVNVRYGYSVDYPADLLVAEPEADAGVGRRFHARQGTAKMSVWAEWNLRTDGFDQSPLAVARRAASDCVGGKVGHEVVKPRIVALSCVTPKGRVIYQKTLVRKDRLATIRFEYPNGERTRWDHVVTSVASSLRQGEPAQ